MVEETKYISANDAYERYRVTRAWLRENADAGTIRRTGITLENRRLGKKCVKFLYSVEDIERELDSWASNSQERRKSSAKRMTDF